MLSDVSSVVIRHLRNSVTKWKTGENIRYFSFKEFTDHEISVPISFTHRHTHTKRWRLRFHAQLINWNSFFFFLLFRNVSFARWVGGRKPTVTTSTNQKFYCDIDSTIWRKFKSTAENNVSQPPNILRRGERNCEISGLTRWHPSKAKRAKASAFIPTERNDVRTQTRPGFSSTIASHHPVEMI